MSKLIEMINETLEVIRKKTKNNYEVGIILGSGSGVFGQSMLSACGSSRQELARKPVSSAWTRRRSRS